MHHLARHAPAGRRGAEQHATPAPVDHADRRRHGRQAHAPGAGGNEVGPDVRFDLVCLGPAHDRVLPDVGNHRDRVEPGRLGGLGDLDQFRAEAGCATFAVSREAQSELHGAPPIRMATHVMTGAPPESRRPSTLKAFESAAGVD
jgi:hypothetical protein